MRIRNIYRYPVKGLSAEALEEVVLAEGQMLPHDREFALAQGDAPFDEASPAWLNKRNFACLMVNERLARLNTVYDSKTGRLQIRTPDGAVLEHRITTEEGRAAIAFWLKSFLGTEARGTPRLVVGGEHRFSDNPRKLVSVINLASIAALAAKMGMALHHLRFRANVYFSGAPAWSEFDWIGRRFELGGATLEGVKAITRCAATTVNPETAERDAQVPAALKEHFGHINLGIYGHVLAGGRVAVGDAITLREDAAVGE
ncbi:MAG: MOSC domain-containing protein [Acetobacteraceae bacterium]|nr:MOSC domain-containing protein [Acetobacteraceae bacterium]